MGFRFLTIQSIEAECGVADTVLIPDKITTNQ